MSASEASTSLEAVSNLEASSSAVSSDTPVMAARGATRGGRVARMSRGRLPSTPLCYYIPHTTPALERSVCNLSLGGFDQPRSRLELGGEQLRRLERHTRDGGEGGNQGREGAGAHRRPV